MNEQCQCHNYITVRLKNSQYENISMVIISFNYSLLESQFVYKSIKTNTKKKNSY